MGVTELKTTYKKNWIVYITLLIVFAVLTACGNNEAQKNSESSKDNNKASEAYTVEHAMGKTEIPGKPEKVVILTNEGTEALLAMDVKPVGAVQSWLGDPWYEHIAQDMEGVENVGLESEPSLEKIAALKPDLIIGTKIRHEKIYEKLSTIAPTVYSETLRGDWKENFKLYAEAIDKEEKGKEVLDQFDGRIAELKEKLGEKTNQEVSVVRFMAGTTRIYYTDSFSGVIFEELGFKRPEHQEKFFTADNNLGKLAAEVGKEAIPEMDGDVLFYFTYAPNGDKEAISTLESWTSDPLWNNLSAVKEGNAHEVSDATWNTAGGVKAANIMLDDIEKIFLGQ
ncbi:ABC transporter substrate-binding protein [Metabacillus arenae]|uniref:Iron-siderophore ABC transporter substrate-binding protein n=1 Tax=Metabacillus arenae TaxID=2771434 RepID=A0A926RY33_9BACI|nr:iron-siderophore ABC transporter substrate-binding protein [Metabacillus arenae]MBD1380777.1 iron-siderophore ABC transporter substrate-binding protein [Metabacillus arenae]